MEKQKIIVPNNVRYLSEWSGFCLPDFPCIINKKLTGCGFTEFCITNNENVILCSPRKILLENKEEQHQGTVLYVKNEMEKSLNIDKDLTTKPPLTVLEEDPIDQTQILQEVNKIKDQTKQFYFRCLSNGVPCKILVTYDSFRHVKSALDDAGVLEDFRVIVDEFQSILTDAKFKSSTEIEFLYQLRGLQKINFVSATPLIDKYLEMLDDFKDLPYYELDWETECPGRIIEPRVIPHKCPRGIIQPACDIINEYKSGNFLVTNTIIGGNIVEVVSKEAVLYVNSVKNICDIIKKAGLTLDNTNILCARTPENEKRLRKAFGLSGAKGPSVIGKVPTRGQSHKMFTLCTRTVYLGADFYSTNARSFIFSDANVDSLAVDIKLDLPQILGRQRLDCNPWKSKADLYYKTLHQDSEMTPEEFDKVISTKLEATEDLLNSYEDTRDEAKKTLAKRLQDLVKLKNYRDDYVAVNTHGGKDLVLVKNDLVLINDMRAFAIQQMDYRDYVRVFSSLGNLVGESEEILKYVREIESIPYFHNKMKFIYELDLPQEMIEKVLDNLGDTIYSKYYWAIPKQRASALKYQKGNLEEEYNSVKSIEVPTKTEDWDTAKEEICKEFTVSGRYSKSYIKQKLSEIYSAANIGKTAKASDLEEYFELRRSIITIDGKRCEGFEIIKKK